MSYNVRFACIDSVEGVKCTLDGVVKYSDSLGLCDFINISGGDHSYSAEKDGWEFVSGVAPFMGSIPQSGTITIPAGWPTAVPYVLELEFVEVSAGAGEFRFDSWSPPLDLREVFIVGAAWPALVRKVDVDEHVYAHYVVKNVGSSAGAATITVKDLDTGATITIWSSPNLAPNERFKTSSPGAYIGKMPNRDWRLQFKVMP